MRETARQFAGASLQRVTIQDNADISMTIEFYSAGNEKGAGRGASALLLAWHLLRRKSNQQPSRFTEVIRLAFAHK